MSKPVQTLGTWHFRYQFIAIMKKMLQAESKRILDGPIEKTLHIKD